MVLGMDGYAVVCQWMGMGICTGRRGGWGGRLCNDTNFNVYSCLLMKSNDYLYIVIQ
jgi:hypothetical protein